MSKKLSEMSLEELWRLFPVSLTEYKSYWADWYLEEKEILLKLFSFPVKIHHIGSTAVCDIWAKPIVDILIETASVEQLNEATRILQNSGYILMAQTSKRSSLNKGYTEKGFAERVFHIHIRLNGDDDEVYFADYLNKNPEIAKEYEALKLDLWKRYEYDRDKYTKAKTDFVKKYTALAKKQ